VVLSFFLCTHVMPVDAVCPREGSCNLLKLLYYLTEAFLQIFPFSETSLISVKFLFVVLQR